MCPIAEELHDKSFLNFEICKFDLSKKDLNLKLTQKEIEIIIYLNDSNKNKTISDLEKDVWGYSPKLETHTVETHVYRLRRKILSKFNDDKFILSEENGYKI